MSYVLNDPADFADESAAGFVAAHRDLVRRVPGGVVRAESTPDGQVAVVIGGGSGHYPAFAGLVGRGIAHGAAMGNVFASPSAQQVVSVATAAQAGAGVLLSYGNYAGDALNFDLAQDQLIADGIPCRTVRVTDDIYSAPASERDKRRGIAGDLTVFRAAGWAAEQGLDLEGVYELARRANDRTRSMGIAFTGCTLPGAEEPLFTVPAGQMAIGMGIHGEPGISTAPLATADELAALFVEALLAELPDDIADPDGARVGVILNGLGSVKAEELFVVYGAVERLLGEAGVTIVDPEVGEYATSFEMAGISLTLFWLDEQLEQAWTSPAYTPAYRKGSVGEQARRAAAETRASAEATAAVPPASDASRAAAAVLLRAVEAVRDVIDREVDELGRLDSVAGDGDHGIGMQRGARAAADAAATSVDAGAGAGTLLALAGDAWAHRAGGTSGALWGAGLRAAGSALGDDLAPDAARVAAAAEAFRETVQTMGKAQVGDKTLVDALVPFVDALQDAVASGLPIDRAWQNAAAAAKNAAQATADIMARLGRARPHMEKSIGTPDPGAVSFALAVTAAGTAIRSPHEGEAS